MPIRLRLSAQIAAILSLLFLLAVGLIAYFNLTILIQVLEGNARLQYRTSATDAAAQIDAQVPVAAHGLSDWKNASRELLPIFNRLGNVQVFEMYDTHGNLLWDYTVNHRTAIDPTHYMEKISSESRDWGEFCEVDNAHRLRPVAAGDYATTEMMTYEYYHTVQSPKGPLGAYHISFLVSEIFERVRLVFFGNLLLGLVFGLTAIVAVAWWAEYAIHRPLNFILQAQERLGKGDFETVIPFGEPSSQNEIATISGSFNQMTTQLSRIQEELMEKSERLMEVNQQYRQLNERLEGEVEEKTEELREFFSLITHELKVPLAAIQGYTHLMLQPRTSELTDKQRKYMQSIGTATWHLLGLVRNMLDSVKYDAGKMQFYFDTFDLAELASEVESQLTPAMDEHRVSLRCRIGPGCETLYGDRTKVGQVLINLISNAARFSPADGEVQVEAVEEGDRARLTVTDHGPGIAAENLPHLFDKFTQFGTADASGQGLGLGLYIVRRIVQGHGQTVEVSSEAGQGTIFTFWLAKRCPQAEPLMKGS
ncbi:MAG TPA: HAMP domain-containing sensor histidine kinase [Candidatus Xenobia bacterium]|jgi:signal transduction histidine kinase